MQTDLDLPRLSVDGRHKQEADVERRISYRVIVKIEVVNEDGEPVNHKGYVEIPGRTHSPLAATTEFGRHDAIAAAHQQVNDLFRLVGAAKSLA
jgi:hypothetical protein